MKPSFTWMMFVMFHIDSLFLSPETYESFLILLMQKKSSNRLHPKENINKFVIRTIISLRLDFRRYSLFCISSLHVQCQLEQSLPNPIFVNLCLEPPKTWPPWTSLCITTKSRNSEQTSFCARYSEQSLNITENYEHWLKNAEQFLSILNIDWTEFEHYWKFWTLTEQILNITENSEHWVNRVWTLLKILSIDWTDSEHYWKFGTYSEHSEQSLNILNIDWTDFEHSEHWLKILNRFWTSNDAPKKIIVCDRLTIDCCFKISA